MKDATKQELHDWKKREEGEALVLMGIENGVVPPNHVFEDYDEAKHPHPQVLITLASGHKMVFTFDNEDLLPFERGTGGFDDGFGVPYK